MSSKSRLYQYRIVEIPFDQNKLNNFPEERGISHILAENEADDKIVDLREDLLDHMYDIINGDYLTEHQKKILLMRLMGKTQNEIADHLGITQSAVHKAIHGNIDYSGGKGKQKRYGGLSKKLCKYFKEDKIVIDILNKIDKIRNNRGIDEEDEIKIEKNKLE